MDFPPFIREKIKDRTRETIFAINKGLSCSYNNLLIWGNYWSHVLLLVLQKIASNLYNGKNSKVSNLRKSRKFPQLYLYLDLLTTVNVD